MELRDQVPLRLSLQSETLLSSPYFLNTFNRICAVINTIKCIECCEIDSHKADHFLGV